MAKYNNGIEDDWDIPSSSVTVLESRYLTKDNSGNVIETGVELLQRVAWDIAVAELQWDPEFKEKVKPNISKEDLYELAKHSERVKKTAKEFFELMKNGYFLPNSPTLMNAGKKLQQLSACFVLPIGDSIEEIFETMKNMAIVHKSGGGTGFSFSKLRPNGSLIKSTQGYSPGPLSFLFSYNESAGQITQGGKRRGANMGIIRANHPDALCFARIKGTEGVLSNFNLSIAFSDEEIEAVKKEGYIELKDPQGKEYTSKNAKKRMQEILFGKGERFKTSWRISEDETKIIDNYTGEEIGKVENDKIFLEARRLFGTIIEGVWKKGEPGIIFIDKINRVNPTPELGEIESTNPCVAEGTLVNTPFGYYPVEELKQGDIINTVFGEEPITKIEVTENVPVFKIKFSDGGEQKVTAAHRYFTVKKGSQSKNLKDFRVDELEIGDYIRVEPSKIKQISPEKYFYGLKRGILLGDGCYTENCVSKNFIKIASNSEDEEYNSCLKNLFSDFNFRKDDFSQNSKSMNMIISQGKEVLNQMSLMPAYSYEKTFDITNVNTFDEALGILDGLLATDGDVLLKSNHPQIRFTTSSEKLAQNIRRLLLMVGCHGRINQSFFDDGGIIDGRKITRKNFRHSIVVSGNSAGIYAKISKLPKIHKVKGGKLKKLIRNWLTTGNTLKAKMVSIEPAGTAKVYDLYCERSDTWITDGYVQRGCGEQPLLPYESCNLGSIDLSKMVKNSKINEELFEKTIRTGTRFLDNVIDRNDYPLREIEDMTKGNRKIGLGVMGFAHLLVKLGVSYNSSEAVEIAEKTMKFISEISKDESRKLAREKGMFPNFYRSVYKNGEIIRNATTTTIAPTGTIGVIASTSQGVEPIFRLITLRNVEDTIGKNLVEIDRAFMDYLKEKGLYTEELIKKLEEGKEISEIPELEKFIEEIKQLFITAHDVSPEQHLKIQAAFQKYTDNAVSKTINMPNKTTKEKVAEAYFLAYELGCKGVTIYRDGSREKQLLTSVLKKEEVAPTADYYNQKERPILVGTTVKQVTPHGKAFITLNCVQNSPLAPYETFINIGKGGKDIPAIAEGLGRLISIAFKKGVPIDEIIEQLEGISGETQTGFGAHKIYSLPDAIAKGLKEASSQLGGDKKEKSGKIETDKNQSINNSMNLCPDCGKPLIYAEGCEKCISCGYSKC